MAGSATLSVDAFEDYLSLSDEQLGLFCAVQYEADCDERLMDILTASQYQLYLKIKNKERSDMSDIETVHSWEGTGSTVSVTPSQAVSGTRSELKKLRIFVTVFSPVVEYLSRDSYRLKTEIKDKHNVDMRHMVHKDNELYTTVKFEGTNKASLLEAQNLLWENLKDIQKCYLFISNENIRAMWEISWEKVDQIIFTNRTNVYPKFIDSQTLLYGFQESHLEKAKELLENYYKTGTLPRDDKNIQVKPDAKKNRAKLKPNNTPNHQRSKPNEGSTTHSVVKKDVTFTMYINASVVYNIVTTNGLKNRIEDRFGVNMTCYRSDKNSSVTCITLRGSSTGILIDAEYTIFECLSEEQQFKRCINDAFLTAMWTSWEKGEKVRFFLETTVFVRDNDNGALCFSGFGLEQVTNAINKLRFYKNTNKKPSQNKSQMTSGLSKSNSNLAKSMDNLSMSSSGSTRPRMSNTPKMERGLSDRFRIDVEAGDETRVVGMLIGKNGMNCSKPVKDLFNTVANFTSGDGCVFVQLSAPTVENINDASHYILRNLSQMQKHERNYYLSPNHFWKGYSKMEKLHFQKKCGVTIDENNDSMFTLKAFLDERLNMAITELNNGRQLYY